MLTMIKIIITVIREGLILEAYSEPIQTCKGAFL